MIRKLTTAAVFSLMACTVRADDPAWIDKVSTTPQLIQTDFGPNGKFLPFDGSEYCGPTSSTMAFLYLAKAGFSQLVTDPDNAAVQANLVAVFGGLMNTETSGGTTDEGLEQGWRTYLAARGISSANYSISLVNHPDFNAINTLNQNQTVVVGVIDWFYYSASDGYYVNDGGHFIFIANQTHTGGTTSLTVHNPFPNALNDETPNLPGNVQQTFDMADFDGSQTDGYLSDHTFLQFVTPSLGPAQENQGVLQTIIGLTIDPSQLPSEGFIKQDWVITASGSSSYFALSPGTGVLDVTTTVSGDTGFNKKGTGEVVFHDTNSTTGDNLVESGHLVSTAKTGNPFGTGSMALAQDGGLALRPDDASPGAVDLALSPTGPLSYSGANELKIEGGANTSVAVTIGDSSATSQNLIRSGKGTLVLDLGANLAHLGDTYRIQIAGSGSALPALVDGGRMVSPSLVGRDDTGHAAFLAYDDSVGFHAATTTTGDLNDAVATDIFHANSLSNNAVSGPASVYALQVDGITISSASEAAILNVGPQSAGNEAGVILNGGQIATHQLNFGASEALIYTSEEDGLISSTISSGGLTKFGPGKLTVSGSGNTITGNTEIHSGIFNVASAAGTGTGNVNVHSNAILEVASSGGITGDISADTYSTVNLRGGTVNSLSLAAGATLRGEGTVDGSASLSGYIAADSDGAGTMLLNGAVTTGSDTAFIFSLYSLVDSSTGTAGTDWNNLVFTNISTQFGTADNKVAILFDFGNGVNPEDGSAFWTEDHSWEIMQFAAGTAAPHFDFPSTSFNTGNFYYRHNDGIVTLEFSAIPEPSMLGLISLGLVGVAGIRLLRQRRN